VWALVTYVIRRRREWNSIQLDAHTPGASELV
jgi:hypothetical protein